MWFLTNEIIVLLLYSLLGNYSGSGFEKDSCLTYNLNRGYIQNWLLAGPYVHHVNNIGDYGGNDETDLKLNIIKSLYQKDSGIKGKIKEQEIFYHNNKPLKWNYYACEDDHLVKPGSISGGACNYLCSWAYAEIDCNTNSGGKAILSTQAACDIWINNKHIDRKISYNTFIAQSHSFQVSLNKGRNTILVRFENVKIRLGNYGMALQLPFLSDSTQVYLPTTSSNPVERQNIEQIIHSAYVDRSFFKKEDGIMLYFSEKPEAKGEVQVFVTDIEKNICLDEVIDIQQEKEVLIADPGKLKPGRYIIEIKPWKLNENSDVLQQLEKKISFSIIDSEFAYTPELTFAERRQKLLEKASKGNDIYCQNVRMTLGMWDSVDPDPFLNVLDGINKRLDCSDFLMIALVRAMYLYKDHPSFPESLKQPLRDCILNFKYWSDEPGKDVMWFWSENHQILFHACEIIAGQTFPSEIFINNGKSGEWHREHGEKLALQWLIKRGQTGFQEWDSNVYFDIDFLALAHLADLAVNPRVKKLATDVLNKMFLTMALNSYKGIFASTHGRTYPGAVLSGRSEGTSGTGYLLWGMGNKDVPRGTIAVALIRDYTVPQAIVDIARDLDRELWNKERHGGVRVKESDYYEGPWEINKVTFRTPDYMLCSAQDYSPGGRGHMQHIWQATIDADALFYVSHPPFLEESGSPNFWIGNLVLPRVAQWKNILIDIRNIPDDDWMGFTHAYFPCFAFDEYSFEKNWIFAARDNAYLAFTALRDIELIKYGKYAYRELRSYGTKNIWFVCMGRKDVDGSFEEFKKNALAMQLNLTEDLKIECNTSDNEKIQFSWDGPLLINNKEVPITGFDHYDNDYCKAGYPAYEILVKSGKNSLKLDFTE